MKEEVLKYLKTIEKWKVTTYKNIWKKFGIHPRAVAIIMKYNKEPEIYPCYKVISSSWKISCYSWIGCVEEKIKRLDRDWIKIVNWKVKEEYIV